MTSISNFPSRLFPDYKTLMSTNLNYGFVGGFAVVFAAVFAGGFAAVFAAVFAGGFAGAFVSVFCFFFLGPSPLFLSFGPERFCSHSFVS